MWRICMLILTMASWHGDCFQKTPNLLFFSLPVIFTKILITELLLIEITMCAGELRRKQHGQVSLLYSQCGCLTCTFKSLSGHQPNLLLVFPSSNPWPRLVTFCQLRFLTLLCSIQIICYYHNNIFEWSVYKLAG